LDDAALGGVTRLVGSLMTSLAEHSRHERMVTKTSWRLPPRLVADVAVVHFTMAWSKLPFLRALSIRARRVILVEHSYTKSFEATCVPHHRRFRRMLRLAYGMAEQVIAVSEGQAHWIVDAGLAPRAKVTCIPCIPDLSLFAALQPPPGTAVPLRLGAFGRYHPQKGFDTLIAAMGLVAPETARLELAGYGPDEGKLRQQAAGLPHVVIGGPVNPVEFLSRIDAIAMPSRWEAGAVSCWEGRAAGRPMIVSSVDGLPEQVPREIGIVVPPDDPPALARAIERLALADRSTMSQHARWSTEGESAAVLNSWRTMLGYSDITVL
jgi:glycosyltransferase involved in cell wall biosynthesis